MAASNAYCPTGEPEAIHNGVMAGKELDPQRARAARDVVRQHPAMSVIALSPALIGTGLVWWLAGPWWAILSLVAATVIGGRAVLRKR